MFLLKTVAAQSGAGVRSARDSVSHTDTIACGSRRCEPFGSGDLACNFRAQLCQCVGLPGRSNGSHGNEVRGIIKQTPGIADFLDTLDDYVGKTSMALLITLSLAWFSSRFPEVPAQTR